MNNVEIERRREKVDKHKLKLPASRWHTRRVYFSRPSSQLAPPGPTPSPSHFSYVASPPLGSVLENCFFAKNASLEIFKASLASLETQVRVA